MKCVLILLSTLFVSSWSQNLVLIGGNLKDDNAVVWNKMVQLAGGVGVAKIGVISASKSNTTEGVKVIDNFVRVYGAKSAIAIPVTRSGANSNVVANLIKDLTGVFIVEDSDVPAPNSFTDMFSSLFRPPQPSIPSDVVSFEGPSFKRQNLIDTLRPSGADSLVLSAVKTILRNGGMVAGNAAIMGKRALILDGDAISALVTGTRFFSFPRVPLVINPNGGLGLLNADYAIESQLSDKGREIRLIRTLIEREVFKGIGVDGNTAFVVTNPLTQPVGTVITAKGSVSGVFFTDVTNIPKVSITNALYENVPFSFYSVNDTIDLTSGKETFASWKLPIAGEEWFPNATSSNDILSRYKPNQWQYTARILIDCKDTNVTSYSPVSISPLTPRVKVFFDRTKAVGYGLDLPDSVNFTYVASYRNMLATVKVLGIL